MTLGCNAAVRNSAAVPGSDVQTRLTVDDLSRSRLSQGVSPLQALAARHDRTYRRSCLTVYALPSVVR
jgi:hypothetical protein